MVYELHRDAYHVTHALVEVRDVPEGTLKALKALAGERGLTPSAYLRGELGRLASRPTNAEIVERLAP